MRKHSPEPIGTILKNVVEGLGRAKGPEIEQILSCWRHSVGKELFRHSQPLALAKGILRVAVDDSAWFYQANLQKEHILQSLKKKIGAKKIKHIQFRIGKIERQR